MPIMRSVCATALCRSFGSETRRAAMRARLTLAVAAVSALGLMLSACSLAGPSPMPRRSNRPPRPASPSCARRASSRCSPSSQACGLARSMRTTSSACGTRAIRSRSDLPSAVNGGSVFLRKFCRGPQRLLEQFLAMIAAAQHPRERGRSWMPPLPALRWY